MFNIKFTENINGAAFQDALEIRKKVFIEEQHVPVELELDGKDDQQTHVILYHNKIPVATARLNINPSNTMTVQRVAVIKEMRRSGYGRILMKTIHQFAEENNVSRCELSAQDDVIPFYKSLGYKLIDRPGYFDAGIPHHDMFLKL